MRKLELLGCLALNRQLRLGAVAELSDAGHPAIAGRQAESRRASTEGIRRQARPFGRLEDQRGTLQREYRKRSEAG